jgi:hypothetical protein
MEVPYNIPKKCVLNAIKVTVAYENLLPSI